MIRDGDRTASSFSVLSDSTLHTSDLAKVSSEQRRHTHLTSRQCYSQPPGLDVIARVFHPLLFNSPSHMRLISVTYGVTKTLGPPEIRKATSSEQPNHNLRVCQQ